MTRRPGSKSKCHPGGFSLLGKVSSLPQRGPRPLQLGTPKLPSCGDGLYLWLLPRGGEAIAASLGSGEHSSAYISQVPPHHPRFKQTSKQLPDSVLSPGLGNSG